MNEVTVTIVMRADGTIAVNAPLDNKVLCYGLLEAAKDAIRAHKPQAISAPPPGFTPKLVNGVKH